MTILPIIISSIALVVSFLTLFLNSLFPFRPKVFNTSPTFSIYKIIPEVSGDDKKRTWWIPSFNLGLSMYNLGKLPGEVLDIRVITELEFNHTKHKFDFYPKWLVDYAKFQKNNTDRFTWIDEAIISNWSPILLFGNKESAIHLILEGPRWDNKFNGNLKCRLEYITSKGKKWKVLNNYELLITEEMFDSLSTYTPYDEKIEKHRRH